MAQAKKYKQPKSLNFNEIEKEMLNYWQSEDIFKKTLSNRKTAKNFIFFEGPPSANGMPGIHHVMSRTVKDVFCRYKTLQGYKVERKAGWDTHGLPVELQVEKTLGITKDDIGKTITIAEYNQKCREDVLKFKDKWDTLTEKIGFWLDMENPYVTYENKYIESVWNLLKRLYDKGFLYKGHTIQPYSPAAGTGLSSHELNQPGTYKDVKDTSVVAQFKAINPESKNIQSDWAETYLLAWTTTPWTLPSNTALGIGAKMDYSLVNTYNPYTFEKISVVIASDLLDKYFPKSSADLSLSEYNPGQKGIPFEMVKTFKGIALEGLRYEQLMPYHQPTDGDAFKVIMANFVTTESGTGLVHLAPSFGMDDYIAGKQNGIGSLTLVDRQGKFVDGMDELSGLFVKNYNNEDESASDYQSTDVKIAIKLKQENKAFKVEKYSHNYPHCWRTDKPILYYPLESWFIKTTAVKDRLVALNKTINWFPASTGEGRFGNWLENLVDWNLSRSRYWGTPLPIWRTDDGSQEKCIGSINELKIEIEKSVSAGLMKPIEIDENFDLHRPYIDDVVLISEAGKPMHRETDLIDVWFDSGAMPYAQWHYPFENTEKIEQNEAFPADFIAEGVDQTRGWFFTLHAISVMLNDSVAYKNVLANGLVLDKNGNKMSKSKGNTIDPFTTIEKHGADVVRWYMMSNSAPWDNLKFDLEGLDETKRKFFGTWFNTYNFFALYANIDQFEARNIELPLENTTELDKWILSKLNSLIQSVHGMMDAFEPHRATRAIQSYMIDDLSNWYVRLNRRRFWKGDLSDDKIAAYQTLYTCLLEISKLVAPFSPFISDYFYQQLSQVQPSVHIENFPIHIPNLIDKSLEEKMEVAQILTSLVLRIRKAKSIKVRQPLGRIMIPAINDRTQEIINSVKDLIKQEVNVKEIEVLNKDSLFIKKQTKPNFKTLGPKVGKDMKLVANAINQMSDFEINELETNGMATISNNGQDWTIVLEDIEIITTDIPGWEMLSEGSYTVALDMTITEDLRLEGIARELINKIQNLRKEKDFEVTDKITVQIQSNDYTNHSITTFQEYIAGEILASEVTIVGNEAILEDQITLDEQIIHISLK